MRIRHAHFTPVAPLPGEPDLFEPPAQRVDTSLSAAARIKPHGARLREAVFQWIRVQGSHGATDSEICAALDLNPSTERPRRRELEGNAPWAPGLPARIQRSPEVRKHMHVYKTL